MGRNSRQRPHSRLFMLSVCFQLCVLMAGIEVIVVWLEFVILQDHLFSLIRFLCLEFQFHFASFLLFLVCLAVITSTCVFLLVLRLRRTLNVEFIAELHIFLKENHFFCLSLNFLNITLEIRVSF